MSGLELNKIAASVLVAALVAMLIGNITDILYHPQLTPQKRGYEIAIQEDKTTQAGSAGKIEEVEKVDIAALMATATADKGKENATKCAICHTFNKGEPSRVGPNLWEIVGSKKADVAGYQFSKAMVEKGGTWTYEDLYHFLRSPRKYLPGTKMGFPGFKSSQDAADTIAYLRSLSDAPVALPQPNK